MWLVLCFQRDLLVIQTIVFKAATAPLVSRYFYFVDYQLGDTKPFEEEIFFFFTAESTHSLETLCVKVATL